ncbi:MAG: RIP metalloprotease RseP [Akkermansiaceae bacterium]|nr:RIP metalloprotease RseP [Akkermansiaceae bacterium]MCF7733436.1 RIP metalloprotease RseP [Akkermansiaceae bacterium]
MAALSSILYTTLLIVVIVMIFNIIIFTHELGHFLAARWRGLQVDRFQIWFGKPIWKKTFNEVQYGLGWLPFGGFVALPQMAPMESIEGGNTAEKPLPPISPLDKIIVAFAGPLFSLLLALACGVVIWKVGKPKDFIPTQEIGYVAPDSPAAKAGLQVGDTITAINGEPVKGFAGPLNSIFTSVVLSRGDKIDFTITRPGVTDPLNLTSKFDIPESSWWQRRALRQIGIGPKTEYVVVSKVIKNSPAQKAGLKAGDRLLALDGVPHTDSDTAIKQIAEAAGAPVAFEIERDGTRLTCQVTAVVPLQSKDQKPKAGIHLSGVPREDKTIVHPDPWTQVQTSLSMMWTTITSVAAPDSNIGIDHLSGPVGIAKHQFALLKSEFPWQRLLAFMVLFNVNLAVLNMLPFPVLDGGHITLAVMESIARRPVKARILEVVQTAFALLLMGLMLYVTTKDIGDGIGGGGEEVVFPE